MIISIQKFSHEKIKTKALIDKYVLFHRFPATVSNQLYIYSHL